MQVLDSCTKNEIPAPFYHQRRGGIKVQDLINRFKSEQKYKDKSKSKSKSKKKERSKQLRGDAIPMNLANKGSYVEMPINSCKQLLQTNTQSNDLYSPQHCTLGPDCLGSACKCGGLSENIEIVKIPFNENRIFHDTFACMN